MKIFNEHGTAIQPAGLPRTRRRQFVALWLGVGALLAHAVAWGVVLVANAVADSRLPLLFIPLALLALALVIIGLGLGLAAVVVGLRALPLATPGVAAVVLGVAGVLIAVLTFFAMGG